MTALPTWTSSSMGPEPVAGGGGTNADGSLAFVPDVAPQARPAKTAPSHLRLVADTGPRRVGSSPRLERIVLTCTARPWRTLMLLVMALITSLAVIALVPPSFMASSESIVGDARVAADQIAAAGLGSAGVETVLIRAPTARQQARAAALLASTVSARDPAMVLGVKPLASAPPVSEDRTIASLHSLQIPVSDDAEKMDETVRSVRSDMATVMRAEPGATLEMIGAASVDLDFVESSDKDLRRLERITLPLTLLVLLIVFRSFVAAIIPVITGAIASVISLAAYFLSTSVVEGNALTPQVVFLLGMALGVDYSLLIIERFRSLVEEGCDVQSAVVQASARTARTVLVCGLTISVSLSGLVLVGVPDFKGLAMASVITAAVTMACAMFGLPAALALLGPRIARGRASRRAEPAAAGSVGRLAQIVGARPRLALVAATVVLLVLAVPSLSARLAIPATGDYDNAMPTGVTSAAIEQRFPGAASPAQVVLQVDDRVQPGALGSYATERWGAVGGAAGPVSLRRSEDGGTVVLDVPVRGSGTDARSQQDLALIRDRYLSGLLQQPGVTSAVVGGETAATVDMNDRIRDRLPIVIAVVAMLVFLLTASAFRSIVVAAKSVALNLLSALAAFGTLILVFQHEATGEALGFHPNGTIVSWLPPFAFLLLFALAMDYHVFVLARVVELRAAGATDRDAVLQAISGTARVVIGAAAVMLSVFATFASLDSIDFQQLGFALAVAVLIDATIVRMIVLPAAMLLLGRGNWWMPSVLARVLPAWGFSREVQAGNESARIA